MPLLYRASLGAALRRVGCSSSSSNLVPKRQTTTYYGQQQPKLGSSSSSSNNRTFSSSIVTSTNNVAVGLCDSNNNGCRLRSDSSMIAANDRNNNNNNNENTTAIGISLMNDDKKRMMMKHQNSPTSAVVSLFDSNNTINSSSRSFSSSSAAAASSTSSNDEGDAMEDEYGEMTSDGESYVHPKLFELECGVPLEEATLKYQTYGKLNEKKDNVLVVCHALTGNASLHTWWGDLLGSGRPFDTDKYFVVCCNILGSCYGSTSPTSIVPGTNPPQVYGNNFPDVSVKDTVKLQLNMLKHHLNIHSIKCVIGGSFGGMQAVEFAAQAGTIESEFAINDDNDNAAPFIRSVIPIACGASHTAWQIAVSECQRQAIYADPKWNNGNVDPNDPPNSGLSVARQIGMVSYRTRHGYESKFGRNIANDSSLNYPYGKAAHWQVKNYLEYQGNKFLGRFDAITYVKMTEQMDSHDVGRNRGGIKMALSEIKIPSLVLGIDSDVLYPIEEQKELARLLPNSKLQIVRSDAGHDGFLLEQEQVGNMITEFLNGHS